jgi:hypothetical protein
VRIAVSGKFSHPFSGGFFALSFFFVANINGPNEKSKRKPNYKPTAPKASPNAIFSVALLIQL